MKPALFFTLVALSSSLVLAQDKGWATQSVIRIATPASNGSSSDLLAIRARDDCDPASFNSNVGPGTCIGGGNTKFDRFLAEVTEEKSAGAWRFNPNQTDAKLYQTVTLENRGGETHTFTKVAYFGGGVVPLLNDLSGNPKVASECIKLDDMGNPVLADVSATNFILPSGAVAYGPALTSAGEQKFQCCIHPWMRVTLNVQKSNEGKGK
jgi:hypothetical protein